ncbi:MAG: hypothetical protein ACRBCI_05015 [Cellvibrionaceae bacterium]
MSDVYKAPSAELHDPITTNQYGSIDNAVLGQYDFQIGALLSEAWSTLKGLKTKFLVGILLYIVALVAISMVLMGVTFLLGLLLSEGAIIGGLLQQIIITLVSLPMAYGLFMMALKHSVNAPTSFTEIFGYFNKMGKIFAVYILMSILIFVGLLLLVLPGIYLMVAYMMAIPLIIEKNDIGVWQALEISRKTITKKWFKFFGFVLLVSLIMIVAAIPLGIGLIWALPWIALVFAILYRNMFGLEQETLHNQA